MLTEYEIYYDHGNTRVWWAFWKDANGHQVGDAVHAATKERCLIELGMVHAEREEEHNASDEEPFDPENFYKY